MTIDPPGDDERERDARRKREQRTAARVVTIPPCANPEKRAELEQDCKAWLRYYFAHIFTYEFTSQQEVMIKALVSAMTYGGDQAIAASRGEGKTTLCECVLAWAVLTGLVSFPVLFKATGTEAEESLATWKEQLIDEDATRLVEDYPEVCVPILALDNVPNRAHYQFVQGRRHDNGKGYGPVSSKFTWSGRKVTMPRVPGSPCSGAILATRGLDAAVRGLKVGKRRPDVAIIDDPDTEETVGTEEQRDKLEKKIDRNIAGLAGQKRQIARVMLTTLQSRSSCSARFTDPKIKPSWKGKRFRFLEKPPERMDLWEEYIQTWSAEMEKFGLGESDDEHARESFAFYKANFEEMNRGAIVANPNRYNPEPCPDGTPVELSALQRYFNLVAKLGQESVDTEYDNNPPEESGPIESTITAYRVERQTNGLERKQIPAGAIVLTQGVDVRKVALHWVVRAWMQDGTGFTIDYGVTDVRGTVRGSDEGVDLAVMNAILERMEDLREFPYTRDNGEELNPRVSLVDAGWRTEAVYLACQKWSHSGGLALIPSMGYGKSNGCARANFTNSQVNSAKRKAGDGYFFTARPFEGHDIWLANLDADRWKAWEHDRWMTDPGRIGAMTLYGEIDSRVRISPHFTYAKHITAEKEVEEIVKGILKRGWVSKSDNNHYLDASYMSNAAAAMCGVKLTSTPQPAPPQSRAVPEEPTQGSGRLGAPTSNSAPTRERW